MTALTFSKETNATPRVIDLAGVAVESITVAGCTGLHFINGVLPAPTVARKAMLRVSGSSDITFDRMSVTADLKAFGLQVSDSSDVQVTNSRFDQCFQAINAGDCAKVLIRGNWITGTNNDSIVFCHVDGIEIDRNVITDGHRMDDRHPDGIQAIYKKDGKYSTGVVITRNRVIGKFQGIFGGGIKGARIEDNFILIDHGNGIAFDKGSTFDVTLLRNEVETLPGSARIAIINVAAQSTLARSGNSYAAASWLGKVGKVDAV